MAVSGSGSGKLAEDEKTPAPNRSSWLSRLGVGRPVPARQLGLALGIPESQPLLRCQCVLHVLAGIAYGRGHVVFPRATLSGGFVLTCA